MHPTYPALMLYLSPFLPVPRTTGSRWRSRYPQLETLIATKKDPSAFLEEQSRLMTSERHSLSIGVDDVGKVFRDRSLARINRECDPICATCRALRGSVVRL